MQDITTISEMLQSEFGKLHAKFRTVSTIHLKILQSEINNWKLDGFITEKFHKQNYGEFIFQPPPLIKNACSIIIIGIPQKSTPVEFFFNGKRFQTMIPPTYLYSKIRTTCKQILSQILGKKGYSVERAFLPLKLLAVKSGLGKYGKNNICYVDGMGSFTRLEAFYTDYMFPTDDWCEKEIMDSCKNCSLCQNICPTHCIPHERILIHADKCLTYLNENEGDFPSWVSAQSHNALVGCLHCQIVCPQNKKYHQFDEQTVTFTEEEVLSIVQKTPREDLSPTLVKKLIDCDMDEYYPLFGRNLQALMNK